MDSHAEKKVIKLVTIRKNRLTQECGIVSKQLKCDICGSSEDVDSFKGKEICMACIRSLISYIM